MRKAVKRIFLLDKNIQFSNNKIGEEALYSFLILWNAKSFSFIVGPVYSYVNRRGSQSDIPMDDPWGDISLAMKNKLLEMNLYSCYADTLNAFILTATIVSLSKMAIKYKYWKFLNFSKKRLAVMNQNIDRQYSFDFGSMDKKAILLYPFLKIGWIFPIYLISRIRRSFRGNR